MKKNKYEKETNSITPKIDRTQFKENSTPIFMTSSFVFDSAEDMERAFDNKSRYIYSRFFNPNTDELIRKISYLEETQDGIASSTGMSAVFASMASLLGNGDHILSCRSIFASTNNIFRNIFPSWGINISYVDVDRVEDWQRQVKTNTKLLYLETPTNPALDVIDLEWVGNFAKKNSLILVVDNCFATPCIQTPAKYGADIVVHSATKYIDGQGRAMGGIILGNNEIISRIRSFTDTIGTSMSPFNAWIMSKSIDTIHIRMEKHSENALKLAKYLNKHSKIKQVRYPFLESDKSYHIAIKQMKSGGGLISFYIKGGKKDAQKFMNNLKIISITPNLGDSKTLIAHPASSTHSNVSPEERKQMRITDSMMRISVGLESIDDIIEDIESALSKI